MSYVEDNLMPNEKVLFSARIHPAVFLQPVVYFLFFVIVTIFAFSIDSQRDPIASSPALMLTCFSGLLFIYAIGLAIQAVIVIATTEFAVTNRRVIAKRGFIRRHTMEMLLQKVESVSVSQNILGRMLNFGTITVTGTGGTQEGFR